MPSNTIVLMNPSGKVAHVKIGFCWPAFLLGPLWALVKRMWLHSVLLIVAMLPISYLEGYSEHTGSMPMAILTIGLTVVYMVVCGRYFNQWRRSTLYKRGYRPTESGKDA